MDDKTTTKAQQRAVQKYVKNNYDRIVVNLPKVEWSETSGGRWEWWHDPGVPLAFPVESASS